MNARGEIVIPAQFDFAYDFHHGLANVQTGTAWGYIDRSGGVVWPPQQ
ncbi:WG repeat-containing protein [Brevibacillus borstelensis]